MDLCGVQRNTGAVGQLRFVCAAVSDTGAECGLAAGRRILLTRCLSGIAVTTLPVAPTSSLVKTFGENAGKYVRVLLLIEYGITGLLLVWFWGWLAVVLVWLGLFVFGAVLTWRRSSSAVSPAIWQAFSGAE